MLDLHYFELPSRIPLAAATEGFADHKKIGSGGFGRVYVATVDRLPLTALLGSAPLSLFSFESRMSSRHVLSLFVVFNSFPLLVSRSLELISSAADVRQGSSVAVKRAKSGHSGGLMRKFEGEIKMLKDCDHPHLLPLLGYCLSEDGPCLISPLMRGGSLGIRLRPAEANPEQLTLLGLTRPLKPLTWTQRVR